MDLDLKALGYDGLRNIPLKQADIDRNRGIAKRMLMGGKTLTGPAFALANNGGSFQPASYIRGGFEGTVPESERYRSGDVGTPNAQGVWRNQFYADQSAHIAAAYPNMTWTSTLRTDAHNQSVGGVEGSNHLKGISFDVDGPDAQRLKQDIDSGKVQGVKYYIGPGYSHIHFDIVGPVSIGGNN